MKGESVVGTKSTTERGSDTGKFVDLGVDNIGENDESGGDKSSDCNCVGDTIGLPTGFISLVCEEAIGEGCQDGVGAC